MKLSDEQQKEISNQIRSLGYELPVLVEELTDHVCTAIETELERGHNFETAKRLIFAELTDEDTEKLQSKVIAALLKDRSIRQQMWKLSIGMALALALWVVIEYLAWLIFEIPELGPIYGFVSAVIIAVVLWMNFRELKTIMNGVIYPRFIFKNGTQLSFLSGCFFLLFLVLFWTFVDPEFQRGFQLQSEEAISTHILFYSSLSGMFFGVWISGIVISGIFSAVHKVGSYW